MVTDQRAPIERRQLPAGLIAYQQFRGTIPSIESVTASVRSWVVTMGFTPTGPMAVEIRGVPSADVTEEYDVEVQLPVDDRARAHPTDKVQIKPFAATDAVVLTLQGPHELARIGEPLAELREWLAAQGLQTTEVVRWVELTDPTTVAPAEQLTELQVLVA
jgi:effector-binding domain-containing protein